jgi:hypothetical protein
MSNKIACGACGSYQISSIIEESAYSIFHCLDCLETIKINKPHAYSQKPIKYTYLMIYSIQEGSNLGVCNSTLETTKPLENQTWEEIYKITRDFEKLHNGKYKAVVVDWKRIANG